MSKDKIKVFHVKNTKNIDIIQAEAKVDSIKIEADKEPKFTPEDIFNVKETSTVPLLGKFINSRRKRKQCVIYVDGKLSCEKLSKANELFEPITDDDRKNIVKREIAKTLGKFQMMKPVMFIVLMILLVIILIMQILILRGVRIV
jgi:hypothetical protein